MKNQSKEFSVSGFSALIQYIYCGEEKTITDITDLDLLFQIYILADKVRLRSFDLVTFLAFSKNFVRYPRYHTHRRLIADGSARIAS
jgi:hypothetical protein